MTTVCRDDVYLIAEPCRGLAELTADGIGSKGVGLARMAKAGLRVPPALLLGTSFSRAGWGAGRIPREEIADVLKTHLERLERASQLRLGSSRRPLILAIRSGAPVSMPGMMDTILNVGVTDLTVHGLVRRTGNPALAWDAYRRLIEGFGELVSDIPTNRFRALVNATLDREALSSERELHSLAFRELAEAARTLYLDDVGEPFPRDPFEQLVRAVEAVFASWHATRARRYRSLQGIADDMGTAVIIQQMVFGNAGGTSGSGVGFTRNPATGTDELYVDFLPNAQGEDVVSGRHAVHGGHDIERFVPGLYAELLDVRSVLEAEFGDLQDFEFTVEDGKLYLLQSRTAKRTPWAALHVAVDLVRDGIIDRSRALKMLSSYDLDTVTRTELVSSGSSDRVAIGVPASVGVAVGKIVLDSERAEKVATAGHPVILVREDADTDDLEGFAAAEGVLTARGGRTSHAAVVMRQLGKPCVVACGGLRVDLDRRRCLFSGHPIVEDSWLSIDGGSGSVYEGKVTVSTVRPDDALAVVRSWQEPNTTDCARDVANAGEFSRNASI